MSKSRSALGRGLGALLPGSGPAQGGNEEPSAPGSERPAATPPIPAPTRAPAEPSTASASSASSDGDGAPTHSSLELPIDAIDPNPDQPRRVFDEEELQRLVDSIQRYGVLQPVVVRRAGDRYELIVGERRWRASRAAGRTTLPAVVADLESRDRLEVALVENVQRHDLNPMELAHAFQALAEAGATQEEIGRRVGFDRSSVANHIRLLDLARDLQEDVETGRITTGHAKALLQAPNPERQRHLRDRIVRDQLSVRATEQLARNATPSGKKRRARPAPGLDPDLQRVVDAMRQRLQTRVRLQGDGKRGRIEIEYFGAEDLQRLAGLLLGDG